MEKLGRDASDGDAPDPVRRRREMHPVIGHRLRQPPVGGHHGVQIEKPHALSGAERRPIRIHGRDYDLACDDGEEEHLRFLADELDDRVRALASRMGGNPGESMALLLVALTMVDELAENKREIAQLAADVKKGSKTAPDGRLAELEDAMAITLEDIAVRIEKIASRIEVQ